MSSGKLTAFTAALLLSTAAARADVEISNKPTSNMSCDAGVCTATARDAVLNVTDLAGMLASGDVAVKTGSLAKDIDVDQPLTWSNTSRLTLDAQESVTVKKQMTVAGQGALTVTTNDTGQPHAKTKSGEFIIVPERGSVQFWDLGSSLIIDGNTYTLVGNIKTLAADIAANPSGFYALAKPYDASGDGTYTTSPISTSLQGTFEGLGNRITSVSVNSAIQGDIVGLFVGTEPQGVIRDLEISNVNIFAREANGIGLLAGGDNSGQIIRCRANGQISFPLTVFVGGLVSGNTGSIIDSTASVRIVGSGSRESIGGLAGVNEATIDSSYALRSVALRFSAESQVGGLVGENFGMIENSFARNHVADGRQNDDSNYGGLVGKNEAGAQIKSTYAAGKITTKSQVTVGGLIGFDSAAPGGVRYSYWDLDMGVSDPSQGAGNITNDPGIKGLTTAQLQSGLPKGFDSKIWAINPKINGGFPYLRAAPPK